MYTIDPRDLDSLLRISFSVHQLQLDKKIYSLDHDQVVVSEIFYGILTLNLYVKMTNTIMFTC